MKSDGFAVTGTLVLQAKDINTGTEKNLVVKNLVVNFGLIGLATVIAGGAAFSPMTHLALGTSNTAPTLGDTTLGSESRRDSATVTQLSSPEQNKVQFQVAKAAGEVSGTFREAGLFSASTGGNMFNRAVFSDFIVGLSEALTVTWLIEVKNTAS